MYKTFLLMLLLLSWSCIKENTEDCSDGFRLQFKYTYNTEHRDRLTDCIRNIRVYVFDDPTGVLLDIIDITGEDIQRGYIDVKIPDGIYTVVAWGGSGEDLLLGGYLDATMTDAESLTHIPAATIGTTTLGDFRMMLGCDTCEANHGDVTPAMIYFDDLFFASARDITVVRNTNQTVTLDFIQNTSTLKITVTGIEYLTGASGSSRAIGEEQPLGIYVTGYNGIYGYNNGLETYAPLVRYEPPYKTLTDTVMEIDVKVQRMELGRHTLQPLMLYAYSPLTGQEMIYPLNVIEAILSVRDADNNYVYACQEDIDRENEFPIEITILHDLSAKIVVEGFEIVDVIPDIRRTITE